MFLSFRTMYSTDCPRSVKVVTPWFAIYSWHCIMVHVALLLWVSHQTARIALFWAYIVPGMFLADEAPHSAVIWIGCLLLGQGSQYMPPNVHYILRFAVQLTLVWLF